MYKKNAQFSQKLKRIDKKKAEKRERERERMLIWIKSGNKVERGRKDVMAHDIKTVKETVRRLITLNKISGRKKKVAGANTGTL